MTQQVQYWNSLNGTKGWRCPYVRICTIKRSTQLQLQSDNWWQWRMMKCRAFVVFSASFMLVPTLKTNWESNTFNLKMKQWFPASLRMLPESTIAGDPSKGASCTRWISIWSYWLTNTDKYIRKRRVFEHRLCSSHPGKAYCWNMFVQAVLSLAHIDPSNVSPLINPLLMDCNRPSATGSRYPCFSSFLSFKAWRLTNYECTIANTTLRNVRWNECAIRDAIGTGSAMLRPIRGESPYLSIYDS